MDTEILKIPAVALRGMVILPGMIAHFDISRDRSIRAIEQCMVDSQKIFLSAQKDVEQEEPAVGQCQAGSLTGAVASERVSEALKGSLRMVGNHLKSAKAEGSLTATPTGGAGTKVGLSDPVV